MKPVDKFGLKVTPAQREFFRYTGVSAALERRGAGSSRAAQTWRQRAFRPEEDRARVPTPTCNQKKD